MRLFCLDRFEPDMLAFSGCYYGGGEKERRELGAIRKRWKTLHVRLPMHMFEESICDCSAPSGTISIPDIPFKIKYLCRQETQIRKGGMENVHSLPKKLV